MGVQLIIKGADFSANALTQSSVNVPSGGNSGGNNSGGNTGGGTGGNNNENQNQGTGNTNGKLPSGYTRCTFIESDGNSYINTQYVYQGGDYVLEAHMYYLGGTVLFGAQLGNDKRSFNCAWYNSQARYTQGNVSIPNAPTISNSNEVDLNMVINMVGSDMTAMVNGRETTRSYGGSALTYLPIYIFAKNTDGTPSADAFGECRLFSFKITVDGVEKINLIPCKENSSGDYGVYDTVAGRFIGASGSGSLTGVLAE